MGDAPPEAGDGVRRFGKTEHFMVLRGLFPSSRIKKISKLYLVI